VRNRMVVFGGVFEDSIDYVPLGDTWSLWPASAVDVPGPPVPRRLSLGASWPNPARAGVTIPYGVPQRGHVTLRICDLTGRVVRTLVGAEVPAGNHTAHWDGKTERGATAAPGVYFSDLRASGQRSAKRLVLLR